MAESRTKKSIRNTAFSIAYQISDVLLNFVLRTIFIHTLGKEYLGLSGLFANILTVLSFMDLGIGGAIVFCLYKPLAEHDNQKVCALMGLYRKVYTCIGVLVSLVGIALTPFLKYIVNLPNTVEHLYLIYWLSIANTAMTYFLAYRRSLLIADQRTDINVKNQMIFRFTRFVLLSFALIFVRNYIVYLALDVTNTFLSNVQITFLVKKRYSHFEKAIPSKITKQEKHQILRYVSSGIFTKFGQTIVNCTDSIIISAFISTVLVGVYSNYLMVISSLEAAVYLLFSGITASIGNFAVKKNNDESEKLFRKVTFGNFVIVLYFTVCLISLLNPFVSVWAGKDYLLSNITVSIIVINFFIASLQKSVECFMGANGAMFYHNRYRSLIEGIVNLVTSLILVKYTNLGITGVFLGTTVCFLTGRIWMDVFVLYKYWFKQRFSKYVIRYVTRVLITVVIAALGKMISTIIFNYFGISIITWIVNGILLTGMVTLMIILLYKDKDEFVFYKQLLFKIFRKEKSVKER